MIDHYSASAQESFYEFEDTPRERVDDWLAKHPDAVPRLRIVSMSNTALDEIPEADGVMPACRCGHAWSEHEIDCSLCDCTEYSAAAESED